MANRNFDAATPLPGSKAQLTEAVKGHFEKGEEAEVIYSGHSVVVVAKPGHIQAIDAETVTFPGNVAEATVEEPAKPKRGAK